MRVVKKVLSKYPMNDICQRRIERSSENGISDGTGERSPTMDTLWDKVKQNLGEWYSAAYDKTDELARIGRKKIDIVGINREIEKHLSELGGRVYDMINKGKKGSSSWHKGGK